MASSPDHVTTGDDADDGVASIDTSDPRVKSEIAKKRALMERDKRREAEGGASSRPSRAGNSPAPGNHVVNKWVVLDLGNRPSKTIYDPWTALDDHPIHFTGLGPTGESSQVLTLGDLRRIAGGDWVPMPKPCDWHCVTGWSHLGLDFRGVKLGDVLNELARDTETAPRNGWKRLYQRSADGYDTTVQRRDTLDGFLAVCDGSTGEMLSEEHGGPRLVFPTLYGWKSAKFLREVRFLSTYDGDPGATIGFWERLGCHPRGRWAETQRWAPGTAAAVWTVLAGITDLYRVVGGERVWETVMVKGGWALGALASVVGIVTGWFGVGRSSGRRGVGD